MPIRSAEATWNGSLTSGSGSMSTGSGAISNQPYSFSSRFEDGSGTNPEEMVGAAHAGCFSMALANDLGQAGYEARSVSTSAEVHINKTSSGFSIPQIDLRTECEVSDISEDEFQRIAAQTKQNCPISQLVSSAQINLEAKLSG